MDPRTHHLYLAADRFWSHVEKGPRCWTWKSRYGPARLDEVSVFNFRVNGARRRMAVHRVAYVLTHGPTARDTVIAHVCGHVGCVSPAHLEARSYHVVHRRGPLLQRAVDRETAEKVLADSLAGVPGKELAQRHGVSRVLVSRIRMGGRGLSGNV